MAFFLPRIVISALNAKFAAAQLPAAIQLSGYALSE